MYKFMSLRETLAWEPLARFKDVSAVARSPRGFLTAYKKAGSSRNLSSYWHQRRHGFIARHMAQVKKRGERLWKPDGQPTRRCLALIMWAYMPR